MWQQALGRAGTVRECAGRWRAARARSKSRRHWPGALGAAARGARAEECEARAERSGRAGAGARRQGAGASRQGARRAGMRHVAAGARGTRGLGTGCAACAHRLGQLGARAPGFVFNLVFRLGFFPKSPNEHCSL